MGCNKSQESKQSVKESSISFFIKHLNKVQTQYVNNISFTEKENEYLQPLSFKLIIINLLKKIRNEFEWLTYSNTLLQFLENKPLENYIDSMANLSWIDYSTLVGSTREAKNLPKKRSCQIDPSPRFLPLENNEDVEKLRVEEKQLNTLFNFLFNEINVSHHLVFELIQIFSELFLNKYLIFFGSTLNDTNYISHLSDSSRKDLKVLIHFITSIIHRFYGFIFEKNIILSRSKYKKREFVNRLVNALIFSKNNNIYYTLSFLFGMIHSQREKKLDKILSLMINAKISHFEVKSVFTLKNEAQPYEAVGSLFKELSVFFTPNDKFLKISEFPETIRGAVDEYYAKFDPLIDAKKLRIDSEQLIPIVIYCVIKSQNLKLVSELDFIKEFLDERVLEKSYYFVTLGIAVDYLIGLTEEEAFKIMMEGEVEGSEWMKEVNVVRGQIRERDRVNMEEIGTMERKIPPEKESSKEKVKIKELSNGLKMKREEKEKGEEKDKEGEITEEGGRIGEETKEKEKVISKEEEEMKEKETEGELNETRKLGLIDEEKNFKNGKEEMDLFGRSITLENMT